MASKALFRWVVELQQGEKLCEFPHDHGLYDIALEYLICNFSEHREAIQTPLPAVCYVLLQTRYTPFKQLTYVKKSGSLDTAAWLPSLRNFPIVQQAAKDVYDFTQTPQYCTIDLRNDSQILFRLVDSSSSTLSFNAILSLSIVKRYKPVCE